MSRSISECNLLVIILSLLVVGCDDRNPQFAIPVDVQAAPGGFFDPLERDKDVLAMNKPGRWRVQGEDRAGHHWEGYVVIEQAPDAYMNKGFFEWSGRRGGETFAGGRYQFEGTYDPETRMVRWTGYTVQDRFGVAGNAHYEATLSPDERKLVNGSWQGGNSIPGTWSAEFFSEL